MTPLLHTNKSRQNLARTDGDPQDGASEDGDPQDRASEGRERGASVASVLIIMAIVFMFFELIVMGGRVAAAYGEVNGAAREAARQGSLAQTASKARDVAEQTADANLDTSKRSCVESNISFGGSFNQDGQFTVALSCRVDLGDFSVLGIPWPSKTFAAQATEIIETYRAVG